jgi:predicted metalloenzyme YecM
VNNKITKLPIFLEEFINKVIGIGIDVSKYNMDHVAYQASSSKDYEETIEELKSEGELIHEPLIGGRRVGMIKLKNPIEFRNNKIIALEIIEQREGQICNSGWEHAEFVIEESYEDLIKQHPSLKWNTSSMDRPIWSHLKLQLDENTQVKFHKLDVLKSIELDK